MRMRLCFKTDVKPCLAPCIYSLRSRKRDLNRLYDKVFNWLLNTITFNLLKTTTRELMDPDNTQKFPHVIVCSSHNTNKLLIKGIEALFIQQRKT